MKWSNSPVTNLLSVEFGIWTCPYFFFRSLPVSRPHSRFECTLFNLFFLFSLLSFSHLLSLSLYSNFLPIKKGQLAESSTERLTECLDTVDCCWWELFVGVGPLRRDIEFRLIIMMRFARFFYLWRKFIDAVMINPILSLDIFLIFLQIVLMRALVIIII